MDCSTFPIDYSVCGKWYGFVFNDCIRGTCILVYSSPSVGMALVVLLSLYLGIEGKFRIGRKRQEKVM